MHGGLPVTRLATS